MTKIVVLQSFRSFDVPEWVRLCHSSVRKLSEERGWTYRWAGDEFFNWAPDWARSACGPDIWRLSDICRLEWMSAELEHGADIAIWVDIDMLIFDPKSIALDLSNDYGFSHELYFDQNALKHGINNALMFFRQNSQMLNIYKDACLTRLAQGGTQARTELGPDLLRNLKIKPNHIIHGCGILNANMMNAMLRRPSRGLPPFLTPPIGAVNLCLNERRFFTGSQLESYDKMVESCTRVLLTRAQYHN